MLNTLDETSADVGSTPDIISFLSEPGEYELTITVCGLEEHLTHYQRRDTGHRVFGILTDPGDNFSIERTNSHLCQMFLMSTQFRPPWNVRNFCSNPPRHGLPLEET